MDLRSVLKLYLVVGPENVRGSVVEAVQSALEGGVTAVQLRTKHLTDQEMFELALQMKEICDFHSAMFLVNDRLDIAMAVGADGVHLGVDDLPLEAARSIAGPEFIIGYSPESTDQITTASERGASYLGIGPIYGTATKSDAGDAIGLPEFTRRMALGKLPTVGIGGISAENAAEVFATGTDGIAVVSAILSAENLESAARQLSGNAK